MEEQKVLKEEMTRTGDFCLAKELRLISREIEKSIKRDEKEYFEKGMSDKVDVSTAWKTANALLGNNKNLAPTAIKEVDKTGVINIVTNPLKLATMFNKFFRSKVKKLREKSNQPPRTPPTGRLRSWLESRGQPLPPFS
jgi:hypothetical protein